MTAASPSFWRETWREFRLFAAHEKLAVAGFGLFLAALEWADICLFGAQGPGWGTIGGMFAASPLHALFVLAGQGVQIIALYFATYAFLVSYMRRAAARGVPPLSAGGFLHWLGQTAPLYVCWLAAGAGFAVLGGIGAINSKFGFATALLALFLAPVLSCIAAFILVRLSLTGPLALLREGAVYDESWEITRGHAWGLFLGWMAWSTFYWLAGVVLSLPVMYAEWRAAVAQGLLNTDLSSLENPAALTALQDKVAALGVAFAPYSSLADGFAASLAALAGAAFLCTAHRLIARGRGYELFGSLAGGSGAQSVKTAR